MVTCDRVAPREFTTSWHVVEPPPHHQQGLRKNVLGCLRVSTPQRVSQYGVGDLGGDRFEALLPSDGHRGHSSFCPARRDLFQAATCRHASPRTVRPGGRWPLMVAIMSSVCRVSAML